MIVTLSVEEVARLKRLAEAAYESEHTPNPCTICDLATLAKSIAERAS